MTGEVERLRAEEAHAILEKKKAAEALMVEVHRSNAEQVPPCILFFAELQYICCPGLIVCPLQWSLVLLLHAL